MVSRSCRGTPARATVRAWTTRPTTTSHTPHKAYIALVPRSEALETGQPPCCKFPSMRRGCVEKIRHQSCIWQCAARSSAALTPQPHCDENESPRMVGHAALIANAEILFCWQIRSEERRVGKEWG